MLAAEGARFADFSASLDDPKAHFDTDHLNRAGLTDFLSQSLIPLLLARAP